MASVVSAADEWTPATKRTEAFERRAAFAWTEALPSLAGTGPALVATGAEVAVVDEFVDVAALVGSGLDQQLVLGTQSALRVSLGDPRAP